MIKHDDPVLPEFTELLTGIVRDFNPHPEFPRFRVPLRETPLDPISEEVGLDPGNDPHAISRNLFLLEWHSGPGYSSYWHLHALRLPSGERAYWVDDLDGRRIIALGPGGVGADKEFARALFASNGEAFRTGILDSAPSRISTCLRGDVLIECFLDAFTCSPNAWEVIDTLTRSDVRQWLKGTLSKTGRELHGPEHLTKAEAQHEFLKLIEGTVSDFTAHPDEPKVRIPRRCTPLYPLAKFLNKDVRSLADSVSYQLFQFAWSFSPFNSYLQQISAIAMADGSRVFWVYLEEADRRDQRFIVGTAGPDVADLTFLQLLFAANGTDPGWQVCGTPPTEIITRLPHTPELIDLFVSAYNGFPQAWDSLSYQLGDHGLDWRTPEQARALVDQYLRRVLR